jgi:putative colanic acid biosynthesis glycosyltransferase
MLLFSIITVCRNNLNELIDTSISIQSQTFKNFEWIVIDGNSTDGTKEWLTKNLDTNLWLSEPDKGIFDAMNKGIRLAKGKFLIFMNSGDAFADNNVLTTLHERLLSLKNEPSFIYGDSLDINETGKPFYRKAKDFTYIKKGMITQHQAMFFNKIHFPSMHIPLNSSITGDYALVCEIIKNCKPENILKLDFPVCRFKMGGTNEIFRFKALVEDYKIRRNILKLSFPEAALLWMLHFIHTIIKKVIPSSRFMKHKTLKLESSTKQPM